MYFNEAHVISIVDDDESVRDSTRTLLRSVGYQVATFESAEHFLDSGAVTETDCMILDIRMSGLDGLELQRRLNDLVPGVPVIFVTAHDTTTNREQALAADAVDFLSKPFEANALMAAVETALSRRRPCRRNESDSPISRKEQPEIRNSPALPLASVIRSFRN